MKNISRKLFYILLLFITASCVSRREVNYIQEIDESDEPVSFENVRTQKIIDVYDKLYIKVYNIDPNVNNLFMERMNSSVDINLISYTVDENGYIDFPFVGNVKLQGLSLEQAKQKLENDFNEYIPNTSIIVRYVGNMITVMGEVNNQGQFAFYDDKINIFQALSYAGGINDYGDKSTVKIIREEDNVLTYFDLDLSKKDIVKSPYYYLNPNDIVIVKPIKAKYRTYRDFALLSMILSSITTMVVVFGYFEN